MNNSIGIVTFSQGETHFRYDLATGYFECLGGGGLPLVDGKAQQILAMLIEAAPNRVKKNTILDEVGVASDQALHKQIGNVRQLLTDLAACSAFNAEKLVKNNFGEGYYLDSDELVINEVLGDPVKLFEVDMDAVLAERRAHDNISLLISDLLELFPSQLSDFFFLSSDGTPLPFFVLDEAKFGRPNFPIEIVEDKLLPPDRGDKSLVSIRKALGKKVYPGQIYRLESAMPRQWKLGRTLYTELVEDCDFFKSNIFSGWGRLCEASIDRRLNFLRHSPIVREWLGRIDKIKNGDFSHYIAGIGFNTPIFREVPNGTLELLYARNSLLKQADGGRLHICPAGMLEFGKGAIQTPELTAKDFSTYAAKEMIEETLRHDTFIEDERTEFLDDINGVGDFMNAEALRSYCKSILDGLQQQINVGEIRILQDDGTEADLSLAAANASINLHKTLEEREMHVIVDAFILRPEIIVPIFVSEKVDLLVSWENDRAHRQVFRNSQDVESLVSDMGNWAAPGLAAAYLTSRNWFD